MAGVVAHAAGPQFPPGSKVGLVPPDGFQISRSFRGFQDPESQAAILALEMPAKAYAEVEKAMTAPALKKQGVIVEKREALNLKSGKAFLYIGRQEANGNKLRKWIFVASSSELTALITVLVPETASTTYDDATIRTALTSFAVRSSVPIAEQLSLLPFKLDDLAGLRPFRVEANAVFLTDGPNDTIDAADQTLLVVSAASGGPGSVTDRENFARNMFAGIVGIKDVRVTGSDVIRLAGQQTHQLMAEGNDTKTGADMRMVQWLRFGNGAFLRFIGISRADTWPGAFSRFRAVRDGINIR
jgi:hypothetical protein